MKRTQQRSLWARLSDESTEGGRYFMERYRALNERLGGALGQLPEQPQDIQGREREIAMLHAILERPRTPVALLLGQAGTGKTALAEQFAKDLNAGRLSTHVRHSYFLLTLRLGTLSALGNATLQTRLATLLDDLKALEMDAQDALNDGSIRLVLFIDEVHMLVTIFGPGTKVGGDVVKDVLARSPIRVIAATTRREYDSTIAVDKPLSERFKQIEIDELEPRIVMDIARNWWEKVAPDCPMPDDFLFEKIIEANAMYRSDSAEPRKSLDILEDLVSYSRRTGKRATPDVVSDIFKRRYSVSLSFEVSANSIYDEIAGRVKGQPHALFVLKRLLRTMEFQLEPNTNKPMATALFTGPTGVGKALADDTVIPTLEGDVPIGQLVAGTHHPFNRHGKPCELVGVYPQGTLSAYRVTLDDGSQLVCNDAHKFSYVTAEQRHDPDVELSTSTLRELIDSGKTTRRGVTTWHRHIYFPAPKPIERPVRDFPDGEDPYTVGLRISGAPGASEDEYVPLSRRFVPAAYKHASAEQRWQLLRGLFDGRGRCGGQFWFPTTSKRLADDVAYLLRSVGLFCSILSHPLPRGAVRWRVVVRGTVDDKCRLLTRTDLQNELRQQARELSSGAPWTGYPEWVGIRRVERMGVEVPMTCIEVDDPEHVYVAGVGHVVTHNTETTKAIAHSMYPGEQVLLNINMPDYATAEHEPAFRKRLGEHVRHTPNSIVLFDELEKGAVEVLDSLLAILDEGIVTYETINREGSPEVNYTSLRNTIVIATTNAGSEVFANDARFSQREAAGKDELSVVNEAEIDQLMTQLRKELIASGFKPELLGRFQRIVPYRSLSSDTILAITEGKLDKLFSQFKPRGYTIVGNEPRQWPKDTYDFVTTDLALYLTFIKTNATDSNAGGARAVEREINSTVTDALIEAVLDSPDSSTFKAEVSRDAAIYQPGAAPTEGGIIVHALD